MPPKSKRSHLINMLATLARTEAGGETHLAESLNEVARGAFSFTEDDYGQELRQGDGQIPEGIYRIEHLNPMSSFYLSMKVGYPNDFDRARAKEDGRTDLGGDIFIHGSCVTIGCVPLQNGPIEEVYLAAVDARTKIDLALETERVALADKRITNSHGASFVSSRGTTVLANSLGFLGSYEQTFCSLSVGIQAGEDLIADRIADDGHPNVDLDRFRLGRAGGEEIHDVQHLDVDHLVLEGSFQRRPHARRSAPPACGGACAR